MSSFRAYNVFIGVFGENMVKSKSVILCFLFLTVFSLSTVFGVVIGEAHPKQRLDHTPDISQPYLAHLIDQNLPFPAVNSTYYHFLNDVDFGEFIQRYQREVLVSLKKQWQLILSVVAISNIYFLYLYQKIISPHFSKYSFT